jgi:predicted component of type VI protein secretion system
MVNTEKSIKILGQDSSCDITLDDASVSNFHARIELAHDGLVFVHDTESVSGTFLHRNDHWIRVRKVILCIGDRIRFGDIEVPLGRLTAVFGEQSNARLETKHFALRQQNSGSRLFSHQADHEPMLQKPRRNPATGKVEERPHPLDGLNETQDKG